MKLIDIYCQGCNTIKRDFIFSGPPRKVIDFCFRCNAIMEFGILCNGGCGLRFRQQDFPDSKVDPDFYYGQSNINYSAFTVDEKTGKEIPLEYCNGRGSIDSQGKYSEDSKNLVKEKIHYDRKKNAGKNRSYFYGR